MDDFMDVVTGALGGIGPGLMAAAKEYGPKVLNWFTGGSGKVESAPV